MTISSCALKISFVLIFLLNAFQILSVFMNVPCFFFYHVMFFSVLAAILKDADLNTTSAKKVRQQIEKKLDIDLSDR